MVRQVVIGELRVQRIERDGGRRSWTIVWPDGTEHSEAGQFLRAHDGSGTQRTYAYLLGEHLRWLERECLSLGRVGLRDLQRYMGLLGAEVRMPPPWAVRRERVGRQRRRDVAEEPAAAVGPRRQPGTVKRFAEFRVHTKHRLVHVEALQAAARN